MDTGSHLLFGATLAGLACADPSIAGQTPLFYAVLTASLIGAHAPDFDTVTRLHSYSAYIRHHRGWTHTLPAILLWPLLIAIPIAALFGVWDHWPTLAIWSCASVLFHIVLDTFNAYGIQVLRPWTRKWVHLDVLCLFDPFLFSIHAVALSSWLWLPRAEAVMWFVSVYVLTALYIGWRTVVHADVRSMLRQSYADAVHVQLIPGIRWSRWQFLIEQEDCFVTGWIKNNRFITEEGTYAKSHTQPEAVSRAMTTDGVRAFLSFAERVNIQCQQWQEGYRVICSDVRFWHNHRFPFRVEVVLDVDYNVIDTKMGWNKKGWEPPYV
ncbi:metal-dependent hydrolase [Paenibacillus taiwanensis]|uniref:metal-dependent hydrolase n=1 Tax=Paenibacillus taiwanensis TaxID=401638 RepID=UPI0004155149|nr:metal-dependent hydrolase [Paenibacillus taiwanensis]